MFASSNNNTPSQVNATNTIKDRAESAIWNAAYYLSSAKMLSSAKLCLSDARHCFAEGNFEGAYRRAMDSLSYSIGILHPVYIGQSVTA